jgi:hypothetical protein
LDTTAAAKESGEGGASPSGIPADPLEEEEDDSLSSGSSKAGGEGERLSAASSAEDGTSPPERKDSGASEDGRRRASESFLPEDFLPEEDLTFFADLPGTFTDPGVLSTRFPTSTEAGAE